MPCCSMSRWKPRFVIVVTATTSTPSSSASTATIWSPSTATPFSSTASMRSPSPSKAIPRSSPLLVTVSVEDLDAVVLGWIVRGGDTDAGVESQERHGGRRHDAGEHRRAARRRDPARERVCELLAGGTRVASDEDAAAARPERGRLAEALDELGRQELAHDAADTVGAEVAPRHGGRS